MKLRPILFTLTLLLATLPLAAEEVGTTEPVSLESLEAMLFAQEAGGCELPDFTGLNEEEITTAAAVAGFEITRAQAGVCPQRSRCDSIGNCGPKPLCSIQDIGQCCTIQGQPLGVCCLNGTIKVTRCDCKCTGNPCAVTCPQQDQVNWFCS